MTPLITCQNLWHNYGDKDALKEVSFNVEQGSVFGLLGKNGAGKSTIINILMGFLCPSGGECQVLGDPSYSLKEQTRRKIGLLHEGFNQYDFMSITELERYYSAFYPHWNRTVFFELVSKLPVPHTRKLCNMSCGQRSQIVLGLLLAQSPKLMILDDYSMGLDVGYRRLFIDYLQDYVSTYKATVLLTSHVVQELDPVIDQMVILKQGKVVAKGCKNQFMQSFFGYRFERSPAAETMSSDQEICTIEHLGSYTTVYGFIKPENLKAKLKAAGVPHSQLTLLSLNLEDAFIGITGKY
ncbi:ABC transporter ATP-binding protein [Shewanella algae]|uniref:ABC transporter ATP-binding protein n=1 Tax=Shewanella algae TaxID=38313 RepID=UPI00313AE6C0